MYLRIKPTKSMARFGNKGKSSLYYVCPYEILQRVGKVAYELRLPSEFASVHLIFHVSMHKKRVGDPKSILHINCLGVKDNLSYEEIPVQISNGKVKKLWNKEWLL